MHRHVFERQSKTTGFIRGLISTSLINQGKNILTTEDHQHCGQTKINQRSGWCFLVQLFVPSAAVLLAGSVWMCCTLSWITNRCCGQCIQHNARTVQTRNRRRICRERVTVFDKDIHLVNSKTKRWPVNCSVFCTSAVQLVIVCQLCVVKHRHSHSLNP